MMKLIKTNLPRKDGNGWCIQKFHELLHVSSDIEMFGSPKNFDTGIMENRLIHVGKRHAKSIQKRGTNVFTRQLGNRIHVHECLSKCKRYVEVFHPTNVAMLKESIDLDEDEDSYTDLSNPSSTLSSDEIIDNARLFTKAKPDYIIEKRNGRVFARWLTKTKVEIPPLIINCIHRHCLKRINQCTLNTELKIDNLLYRCHPNYRGGGPWHDWCMVDYVPSPDDIQRNKQNEELGIISAFVAGYYPAKILAFFDDNDKKMCLIHTCETKQSSDDDSCLTERWVMEYSRKKVNNGFVECPVLRVVEATTIRDRVYVIEENMGLHENIEITDSKLVILVKPRGQWSNFFTYR